MDLIKLNLRGQSFFLSREKLSEKPKTLLGKLSRCQCPESAQSTGLCDFYLEKTDEFYFDRSPVIFQAVAEFYKSGALHCPYGVCHKLLHEELIYWGLIPTYFKDRCEYCMPGVPEELKTELARRLSQIQPKPTANLLNSPTQRIREQFATRPKVSIRRRPSAIDEEKNDDKEFTQSSSKKRDSDDVEDHAKIFLTFYDYTKEIVWTTLEYPGYSKISMVIYSGSFRVPNTRYYGSNPSIILVWVENIRKSILLIFSSKLFQYVFVNGINSRIKFLLIILQAK